MVEFIIALLAVTTVFIAMVAVLYILNAK